MTKVDEDEDEEAAMQGANPEVTVGKNSRLTIGLAISIMVLIVMAIASFYDFRGEVIQGRIEFSEELSKTRESFARDVNALRSDSALWANDLKHASLELSKIAQNMDGHFKLISELSQKLGSVEKDLQHLREKVDLLERKSGT